MRQINADGLALIKQFEGLRLKAYKCPAGVWTVGYGSTGSHVKPDTVITADEAENLLLDDLVRFEQGVALQCPVATDSQFAALVAFAFNVGLESLRTSTLRRMHNEGNYAGAAGQFGRWNKGGGRVLPGLIKRRAAEAALYAKNAA
jgi:lysozyme